VLVWSLTAFRLYGQEQKIYRSVAGLTRAS
jgi:hypothetical protein